MRIPVWVAAGLLFLGASLPAVALTTVSKVVAGEGHTCALTTGGGVKCWGNSRYGQVGDGVSTVPKYRFSPVDVVGLLNGVAAIAAGNVSSCALTTGGGVKCWGNNGERELGDGTLQSRGAPVDVVGLSSGISAIAGGHYYYCALTTGGGVKCWGAAPSGRTAAPTDVVGLASGVAAIAAGNWHACVLTTAGGVKCWGNNLFGQLGYGGTAISSDVPVSVSGLASGVVAITSGETHSCALTTNGAVKCWGANDRGQLGNNSTTFPPTPVTVAGLGSGVMAISAGFNHTCAIVANGTVNCWGSNSDGQLGDNTTTTRLIPVPVSGLAGTVISLAIGGVHTCAIPAGNAVRCWGNNVYGQLGDGDIRNRSAPASVSGLVGGIAAIATGDFHGCSLSTAGAVKCWGYNAFGQLGDGTTTDRSAPVDVSGLGSGVSAITAGGSHSCALTAAGAVKCWGYNSDGQLGDNSSMDSLVPVLVYGLASGVAAISAGDSYTCALTTGGGVKCWGMNRTGQLGDASRTSRRVPVDVVGLSSGISAISAGGDVASNSHTCALTTGGGVKCWGDGRHGQLGEGVRSDWRTAPVEALGLGSGVSAIAIGGNHSCALTTSGSVKCWGQAFWGALGNNDDYRDQLSAVDVYSLSNNVVGIAAGSAHSCAIVSGGGAKCWGRNESGELGADATAFKQIVPVSVAGLVSGVATVAAGNSHICALMSAGGVQCLGENTYGQLGDGRALFRPAPVSVVDLIGPGASLNPVRLSNLSTRGQVQTGDNRMIGGFIISGAAPKKVLVTARGPSLTAFGVVGAMANPSLQLVSGQTVIASNDDFGTASNVSEIQATGRAPTNALESAILTTLNPGPYTAIVSGVNGGTGVGIVEVFELDRPDIPLTNLSTRGQVQTGDNVMIGGFVIEGTEPKTVLIRANGPSLTAFGVQGALANPSLRLNSGQTVVAANDDWQSASNAAAIQATGLAPTNPLESAILVTLNPGAYTAIVSGVGGGTGVGIVEVFAR